MVKGHLLASVGKILRRYSPGSANEQSEMKQRWVLCPADWWLTGCRVPKAAAVIAQGLAYFHIQGFVLYVKSSAAPLLLSHAFV